MRSEREMLALITEAARSDENIRAAYPEGSRVNPAVPKDIFQAYDVVYVAGSTKPCREAMSPEVCYDITIRGRGVDFAPNAADAFLAQREQAKAIYGRLMDSAGGKLLPPSRRLRGSMEWI